MCSAAARTGKGRGAITEAIAIDLPLEPLSARQAREQLEPFRKALDEVSFLDLRILVSELVIEALNAESEAQDAKIQICVELQDDRVHAEISDGGAAYRVPPRHPEPGERGWALYLVRRLSRRWGVRCDSESSMVWLEMPRSQPGRLAAT
jgi:anti-sigma regulatory factor (Ser/Thr protein kinase)